MLNHVAILLVFPAFALSVFPAHAQVPERFEMTSRVPVIVWIRGSDAQGLRNAWHPFEFSALKKQSIALQGEGFEPFDIRIVQPDGIAISLDGLYLCRMMRLCKTQGIYSHILGATVAPQLNQPPKAVVPFTGRVAESHVEIDFHPFSLPAP